MKRIIFTLSVLVCFINMKCESNDDDSLLDTSNLLVGSWNAPEYSDNTIILRKTTTLKDDAYGITFKSNGDVIERSSGWCGTPPLSFNNYEGKWELTEDLIAVTQDNFPNNYAWRIMALSETELTVTKTLTDRERDHRDLMDLFDEASNMIAEIPCDNDEDWTFTTYGAKACGGPQGFLAYPKTMDTAAFLEKITAYTEAEAAYNEKWGIFSTCDVPAQPEGVTCVEGQPNLIF